MRTQWEVNDPAVSISPTGVLIASAEAHGVYEVTGMYDGHRHSISVNVVNVNLITGTNSELVRIELRNFGREAVPCCWNNTSINYVHSNGSVIAHYANGFERDVGTFATVVGGPYEEFVPSYRGWSGSAMYGGKTYAITATIKVEKPDRII